MAESSGQISGTEPVVVDTTAGPAVAPTRIVDALRGAGRCEPFEVEPDPEAQRLRRWADEHGEDPVELAAEAKGEA